MKKLLIIQLFIGLLVALVVSVAFYYVNYENNVEEPSRLETVQESLNHQRSNVFMSRSLLIDLISLNPGSTNFINEKTYIIEELNKITQEAKNKENHNMPEFSETPFSKLPAASLYDEIRRDMPGLNSRYVEIIQKQDTLVSIISEKDMELESLYEYGITNIGDVGETGPAIFIEGLRDTVLLSQAKIIGETYEFTGQDGIEDSDAFQKGEQFTRLYTLLDIYDEAVQVEDGQFRRTGDLDQKEFEELVLEIQTILNQIKVYAYEYEISDLRSVEGVSLVKDQTDLVYEYDSWLEKIALQSDN